jgi:hypothetical protein
MTNEFGSFGLPEIVVVLTTVGFAAIIILWPVTRVLRRLGFSPWLAPLAVIPLLNIGLLYFVAFAPAPDTTLSRERG